MAKNKGLVKKIEALIAEVEAEGSKRYAAGYDEGYYAGRDELADQVREILDSNRVPSRDKKEQA